MEDERTLLKIMLKSGQVIQLFADNQSLMDLYQNPKFLPLFSSDSEVMVSMEDISAYEIVKNVEALNTPPDLEANAEANPTSNA